MCSSRWYPSILQTFFAWPRNLRIEISMHTRGASSPWDAKGKSGKTAVPGIWQSEHEQSHQPAYPFHREMTHHQLLVDESRYCNHHHHIIIIIINGIKLNKSHCMNSVRIHQEIVVVVVVFCRVHSPRDKSEWRVILKY